MISEQLRQKWERVKLKNTDVVVTKPEHDLLIAHFKDQDTEEAHLFFHYCATMHNPAQVGAIPQYILFVKEPKTCRQLLKRWEGQLPANTVFVLTEGAKRK